MSFGLIFSSFCSLANVCLLVLAAWGMFRSRRIRPYPLPFSFFVFSALFSFGLNCYALSSWMDARQYARLYWASELIEQGFALSIMVVVMRFALRGERTAAVVGQCLASVAVVMASAVLADGQVAIYSKWMTGFVRNLSFGVALMNFQVWGLLLVKRVSNREILLLASGVGLLTTGKSLGHTIRIVAARGGSIEWIGNYLVIATSILAAYAWWVAFRPAAKSSSIPQENGPHLVKAA